MKTIDWTLCLIADTRYSEKIDLTFFVENAVRAGATLVQLRSKHTDSKTFLDWGSELS
ncbi:MAG: hypothetical protein GF421_03045, partial [Candidatus Aminicenantes bacterium]|nr:hypothetical protein [Candidatus Aminicenantes bacterium]